jgi:cupin 2 domain-containing protein
MTASNLFADIPGGVDGESVEKLASGPGVRIERIVSRGQASPEGFWYDQEEREWVVVVSGRAALRFEGDADDVVLTPGDHVDIPAHRRHRVQWTAPDEDTIWLAVFYPEGGSHE